MSKWCSYCHKDNHSDAECWCTRACPMSCQHCIGYGTQHDPQSYQPFDPASVNVPLGYWDALMAEMKAWSKVKEPDTPPGPPLL